MQSRNVLALILATALVGCSSTRQQVVGTWKGEIAAKSASDSQTADKDKSFSDGISKSIGEGLKSFVSAMIGPLTFEFNDKGRYKLTMRVGSQEGSYTVNGNEVKIDSDDGKSHSVFTLGDDGKTMTSKKDFKSDETFVLKKQVE